MKRLFLGLAWILATAYLGSLSGSISGQSEKLFLDELKQLNGDIFWKPADKSDNPITKMGDEARAIFGSIPAPNCIAATAQTFPLEVDGNIVELKPNLAKPDHPLEFEHRGPEGNVVKWTRGIPRCDKPSLTGSVTYCGFNSRLNRVVQASVEWLFFCRKSNSSLELSSDPYWLRSNTQFALFGAIGFNRSTGEIVFFDGRKDKTDFDWSKPFVPPGGRSYGDQIGRALAEAFYDPKFHVACHGCHDNKNAYVITPHARQARVGYFGGHTDQRALAFSLGNYLPKLPRNESSPFRVVGSGYTGIYAPEFRRARTVRDPTGNCTGCHTLTTLTTGKRFAADAVSREPWVAKPTWAQILELREEKRIHARVGAHRTSWALRSGQGKIHPWMVPFVGNDLSHSQLTMSSEEWKILSNCLWGEGGEECGYQPLYSSCPAPRVWSQRRSVHCYDSRCQRTTCRLDWNSR